MYSPLWRCFKKCLERDILVMTNQNDHMRLCIFEKSEII